MAFILKLREPSVRYQLAVFSLLSIVLGMFFSRAMMSIGMILIGLQFFLAKDIKKTWSTFVQDKVLLSLSVIFFVYLMTAFYSENKEEFLNKISLKAPMLVMALGFAALKEMPKKYLQTVLVVFIVMSFITSAISVGIYILNFDEINESYKYAKVIPNIFSISHIRFSLMLVMAVFSAFYLVKEKFSFVNKNEHYFYGFMGVFIFLFINLLSVRSGLLALYSSCFVVALSSIFLYKKYLLGTVVLIGMMAMPLLAYFSVPTVKNKVDYMVIDVTRFINGEGVNYWSDGNRLLSLKIGLDIGKKSPWLGVGVGDVWDEMCDSYKTNYPDVLKKFRLIPHNQFLYVFVGAGAVGLLFFAIAAFYPFFVKETYTSVLFLATLVTILSSYMSEATLENQLGVMLFVTFYLMGWYCKESPKISEK